MKRYNQYKSKNLPELTIFEIKESPNYQGAVYLDKEYRKSSGTNIKEDAERFLENWVREQKLLISHGLPTSKTTVGKLIKFYLKDVKNSMKIEPTTKGTIKNRFNRIKECKDFLKLDVAKCTESDVEETFLHYMLNRKPIGKTTEYRGKTLQGLLVTISGFFKWCAKKKYRDRPMEGLGNLLSKEKRNEDTSRDNFSKEEYNQILKKSRERFKTTRSKRDKFKREKLHYFIIFMCGTGLRVEECMTLHFNDIEMITKALEE